MALGLAGLLFEKFRSLSCVIVWCPRRTEKQIQECLPPLRSINGYHQAARVLRTVEKIQPRWRWTLFVCLTIGSLLMWITMLRRQGCQSSSGDEVDCLSVAICSMFVRCYFVPTCYKEQHVNNRSHRLMKTSSTAVKTSRSTSKVTLSWDKRTKFISYLTLRWTINTYFIAYD